TLFYLGHGISACHYAAPRLTGERETTSSERAYRELTAMSGEMVLGTEIQVAIHVEPAFRHPLKDSRLWLEQEHGRAFAPRYHHTRSFYLRAFALRQDAGYYVFSLREIIV
ncbi:MAG: hypothetical protein LBK12_00540, partial [Odoribacteraceae bacterium]|nr:hypothetical protein [Odoribacteraceae bacterium]